MNKRSYLFTLLAGLALASCGGGTAAPAVPTAAPAAGSGTAATTAPAPAATAAPAAQGGQLNIVAWEGYVDDSWKKPFEDKTGCKISVTYAGSSDEMFSKFRSGGGATYDLVSASGDASLRFIQAGALQEVDISKVSHFSERAPQLQSPPHNTVDGKHYGVSFMWGPNVLIYDKKAFPDAPKSWSVLYDAKNSGKITIPDNPIQIADVALMLGMKDPYELTDADLAKVKEQLAKQRPLVRKFWASAGDFTDLFKNGEATLGAGWPLMTNELRKDNAAVDDTIPQEGATGWADSWMISKNSPNVDCAYKWIDYTISPEVQKMVVGVTAYSPANLKTADLLGADEAKKLHINDPAYFNSIKFWRTPANYDAWVKLWNEIKQ